MGNPTQLPKLSALNRHLEGRAPQFADAALDFLLLQRQIPVKLSYKVPISVLKLCVTSWAG